MDKATTKAVVDSFSAVVNRKPAAMRKTMTYDQGREMYAHKTLTERTGVQIYFADPHSPWQRGSNENTNGLLRQYMPKGRTCRFTPRTSSTPSRSRSIPGCGPVSMTNRHSSLILSTSRCYKHQPPLLINPVLRLLFETALNNAWSVTSCTVLMHCPRMANRKMHPSGAGPTAPNTPGAWQAGDRRRW